MDNFFTLFMTLLAITNPIGNAAIFISLTQGVARKSLMPVMIKTGIASFVVMLASAFIGIPLLHAMGITLHAFMFAGGLILLKIGFSMFAGSPDASHYHDSEHTSEMAGLAISPLTIPLIVGPGTMVAVIHFVHGMSFTVIHIASLMGVLAVISVIVSACLYATTLEIFQVFLSRKTNIGIISRLCGILIIAIGSEMLLTALRAYLG